MARIGKSNNTLTDNYINRTLQRLRNYMDINGISQNELASYCNINQSSISKLLSGSSSMSLSTLLKICQYLKLDPADLLSSKESPLDSPNTFSHGFNIGYHYTNDDSLIYDSYRSPFKGILGEYNFYCKPTISSESGFLKGVLSLNHSYTQNNYCKATLELYTGKTTLSGEKEKKNYVGEMIISLPMSSCYIILSSQECAEYCFLNFHHMFLNNANLECRFAFCLISSAGSNRRPTVEKAILSRTELSDEDLDNLDGQMNMNTATLSITKQKFDELADNVLPEEAKKIIENLSQTEQTYFLDESIIRGSNMSAEDKLTTINLLRKHSSNPKYSKISNKSDELLYNYIYLKKQAEQLSLK